MSKMSGWFEGLVGLLVVAALALALAWLFGGAGQAPRVGQEATPTLERKAALADTPSPRQVVTPTTTLSPTGEVPPPATPESQEMMKILYAVQPPGKAVILWTLDYNPTAGAIAPRELTTSPYESAAYMRVYEVSVSPDGQYVALNLRGGAENLDYAIWTVQTDGVWLSQLQSLETSPPVFWDWMPDSKRMLVGERDGEAVGTIGIEKWDFYEFPLIPKEDYYHTVIDGAISPDGQEVAFSINEDNAIWLLSLDGNALDLSSINKFPVPKRDIGGVWPQRIAWSPNGKEIAYFELLTTEMSEIQVMELDGGQVTFLSSDDAHNLYPAWSPDGAALVYIGETTPGIIPWIGGYWTNWNSSVWVAEPEAGRYYELVPSEGKACWSATWLPDGSGVVFVSNRKGQSDVWAVNRDGTGLRPLTDQGDVVALDVVP
jgi:WD40 repeat protein